MYIYIICSFLFLASIIKKDSKVLFLITFLLLWILVTFNYNNADYNMYQRLYNLYGNSQGFMSSEILFQVFCKIGNFFGMSYRVFRAIYSTITIVLLANSFKHLTKNCSIVSGLYMIFPFLLDAVQIRHFMAIALVIYGLRFLVTDNNKDIWKYIVCNILAIGFHYIAIFCLLFVILKFFENKKILIFCIALDLILIILIISGIGVTILSYILPMEKVQAYFITNQYKTSFLIMCIATIIQILTIIYANIISAIWNKKYINNIYEEEENKNIEKEKKIIDIILKINTLSLLLIPTFFFNIQMYRMSRTILILDYIMLGISLGKKNRKDNIFLIFFTIIILICFLYLRVIQNNVFNSTIGAMVNYNYLLDKIF